MIFGHRRNPRHNFSAAGRLPAGEMNKTEARYEAEVLKPALQSGEILWYKFEAIRLVLADGRRVSLTVDFAVVRADGLLEFIDVKGARALFTDDAKAKMGIAASAFPFVFSVAFPLAKKDGGGWEVEQV